MHVHRHVLTCFPGMHGGLRFGPPFLHFSTANPSAHSPAGGYTRPAEAVVQRIGGATRLKFAGIILPHEPDNACGVRHLGSDDGHSSGMELGGQWKADGRRSSTPGARDSWPDRGDARKAWHSPQFHLGRQKSCMMVPLSLLVYTSLPR